jgi:hypothetical protein
MCQLYRPIPPRNSPGGEVPPIGGVSPGAGSELETSTVRSPAVAGHRPGWISDPRALAASQGEQTAGEVRRAGLKPAL